MKEFGTYLVPDLPKGCLVFSFGVGGDIDFEVAIRDLYGCRVYLFDPTPPALESIERLDTRGMLFTPIGASDKQGEIELRAPTREGYASYSASNSGQAVSVRVDTLGNLVERFMQGNPYLIKLDIEGMELAVLREMGVLLPFSKLFRLITLSSSFRMFSRDIGVFIVVL